MSEPVNIMIDEILYKDKWHIDDTDMENFYYLYSDGTCFLLHDVTKYLERTNIWAAYIGFSAQYTRDDYFRYRGNKKALEDFYKYFESGSVLYILFFIDTQYSILYLDKKDLIHFNNYMLEEVFDG